MLGLGGLSRATVGRSSWQRFSARFDWPLFVVILAIAGIGLLNLYSALSGTKHEALFTRQIVWMVAGLFVYVVMTVVDYRFWQRFASIALGVAIGLVILVFLVGLSVKGAQRWIGFGIVSVQPSEIAKIAVILALAKLVQDNESGALPDPILFGRIAALFLPALGVLLQPDLGSASLIVLIIVSVGYFAVRELWKINAAVMSVIALLPVFWERMEPYQRDRVLCFLDPSADPTGVCWHTQQSIMAVGAGRLTGEGYMNGTQNQFKFLPEHWTDFPFSVFAEEWGFFGCLFLIGLFAFLTLWILNAAMHARDQFGAVVCLGVAALIFWHTIVNIAMVLGLAPVVGVTLPLVSYGGSSVLTIFVALGLVSSVSSRRHGF
jgi:rod shape determining protein RodA